MNLSNRIVIGFLVLGTVFIALPRLSSGQLTINLTATGNKSADVAFRQAADFIVENYDDDITFNITTGFAPLANGVIAQASTTSGCENYSSFRNQIIANIKTDDDVSFATSLNPGNLANVWVNLTTNNPNGSGSPIPYIGQVSRVFVTFGNAKALGLRDADNPAADTAITFNSNLAFDFDPSDGITAGQFDFVGVAIHEMFHAMGYSSAVDVLGGFGTQFPLDQGPLSPSVVDFLRHSPDSETAGADLDFTADGRAKYYSIDGGITPGASGFDHWSRGFLGGDFQPSHWRDNQGLGIMDPTTSAGVLNLVTELDLQALDLMGWDRVFSVTPDSYTVLIGDYVSGSATDLSSSDDLDLVARRSGSTIQSIVEVEFDSTSPVEGPSELTFCFEASVFARGAITQTISLFNYDTGAYEVIDTRNASRFSDSAIEVQPSGDVGRFVESGTSAIKAKVRFRSDTNRQNFSAGVDQVKWRF